MYIMIMSSRNVCRPGLCRKLEGQFSAGIGSARRRRYLVNTDAAESADSFSPLDSLSSRCLYGCREIPDSKVVEKTRGANSKRQRSRSTRMHKNASALWSSCLNYVRATMPDFLMNVLRSSFVRRWGESRNTHPSVGCKTHGPRALSSDKPIKPILSCPTSLVFPQAGCAHTTNSQFRLEGRNPKFRDLVCTVSHH